MPELPGWVPDACSGLAYKGLPKEEHFLGQQVADDMEGNQDITKVTVQ